MWFRDQYKISPNDDRYLEMTDVDIATEFHIWNAFQEDLHTDPEDGVGEEYSDNGKGENELTPLAPNEGRKLSVMADKKEFREWYESNIGEFPE